MKRTNNCAGSFQPIQAFPANIHLRLPGQKRSTRDELFRRLSMAKVYMERHFCDPISLENVSREAALSRYHLIRSFKKVFGITPYQYLLQLRMDKARKMLLSTKLMVHEIATCCGFADVNSFGKTFKNYYGTAPTKFRKQMQ